MTQHVLDHSSNRKSATTAVPRRVPRGAGVAHQYHTASEKQGLRRADKATDSTDDP
jgi:hypothetical protein